MQKIAKYTIIALLIVFIAAQSLFIAIAHKSETHTRVLASELEKLNFGITSEPTAVLLLSRRGFVPEPESCSSYIGSCNGLYLHISSYPDFSSPVERRLSRFLARGSLIRPSTVEVDLYFVEGTLNYVIAKFERDQSFVGISQYAADQDSKPTVEWSGDRTNGTVNSIRAKLFKPLGEAPDILQQFNLNCIGSIHKCADARDLWPSAPPATSEP